MQQKLKSVFRRSSKARNSLGSDESNNHPAKTNPPRGDRQRVSLNKHNRTSVDSSATGSVYTGRSRPVSSIYDETQFRAPADSEGFASPTDPNGGAIANDYKAYLPALSPVNDEHGDDYITLNKNGQHNTGRAKYRHEEDVADRNIARYSGSFDGGDRNLAPSTSLSGQRLSREASAPGAAGAVLNPVRADGHVGKRSAGSDNHGNVDRKDGVPSQTRIIPREGSLQKKSSFPPGLKPAQAKAEIERKPLASGDPDKAMPELPGGPPDTQVSRSGIRHATLDGTKHGEETALATKLREDGVADLRSTVDTDGDITWAPGTLYGRWVFNIRSQFTNCAAAVTHEVIKPHQHEIVKQKIYREIHNYEYFHRIQPVIMTEVLPPRHWIPNPDGEGLIEISAEELPARTGDNRWWSICEHSKPHPPQPSLPKYRTTPEIIEAGTFVTEEGFERKETIIIHPPTLADLTGYGGPVQAMHFDHKTGKSWMGELTTMDKLEQLQRELDRAPDTHSFEMDGLADSLPNGSQRSARSGSTSVPFRKPVSGHTSTVHA